MVDSELFLEMVRCSHNGGNAIRIGQVMGKRPAGIDFSKKSKATKPAKQNCLAALPWQQGKSAILLG